MEVLVIRRFSTATANPEDLADALLNDGCAIIENAVAPEIADAIIAEMKPYTERVEPGGDNFTGTSTQRAGSLIARSQISHQLATHPLVLAAADSIIGQDGSRYQLHLTQIIKINPGETVQPLHQDKIVYGHDLRDIEPQLHTMWALTDFTEATGATRIVPGSHLLPSGATTAEHTPETAYMPKGSVLLFTGSVYHGGGANRGNKPRWGLVLGYSLSWLRQEENQFLICPPEMAAKLDPELAALIGYTIGGSYLGYCGDLEPPEVVTGHPPKTANIPTVED